MKFFALAIIFNLFYVCQNVDVKKCIDPQFKHKIYSNSDGTLAGHSVIIMEFIAKCKNGIRELNLFAQIDDELKPISKSLDGSKYEVSWLTHSEEPKKGSYAIKIFYEEDLSKFKKGNKELIKDIKPLYSLDYKHKGIYTGPVVKPQMLLIVISLLIWYFAYSTKTKIMN